jgi:hemerythrin
MTVLFSDIRDFTTLSESMSPTACFDFINAYLAVMEPCVTRSGGVIDKYIGDAIFALFPGGADDAVVAALAMLAALPALNELRPPDRPPVAIGIGLNTGMVAFGLVGGPTRMEPTVMGDAVNLGARLETSTKQYGTPLLIGERTLYHLRDPSRYAIRFLDRIRVKGKSHPESVYEVFEGDPPAARSAKLGTRRRFEEALAYYHLKEVGRAVPLLQACLEAAPTDRPAAAYLARCRTFLATGHHEGTGELDAELEWSERFALDFEVMDVQHRELLGRINLLREQVRRRELDACREVMGFVSEYAVSHFATEERLMRESGYPFREQQRREHGAFIRYFGELRSEIDSGTHDPTYLAFRVQLFLIDWFVNHTSRTDRHLAHYLRGRRAEALPSSVL